MIAALPLITSALSLLAPSGPTAAASTAVKSAAQAGTDFGQVMAKVSSDAVQSVKTAEKLSVDGIEGKANVQSVVEAVMTAQENLQTALAIRDKSVAAFQEITRMAI
jgi:flagellar hook-basal body complex protein FliE